MSKQAAERELLRYKWMNMKLCERIAAEQRLHPREVLTLGFRHGIPFLSASKGYKCPDCGNEVPEDTPCGACGFDVRYTMPAPDRSPGFYLSQVPAAAPSKRPMFLGIFLLALALLIAMLFA